jgi:subfamily B ATP-binding cassette protein MsbA
MITKRLLKYSIGYKREFFFAIIGMILVAVCTSLSAYLVKPVLDEIFINKDRYMLSVLPIAIVIVHVLKSLGRYI